MFRRFTKLPYLTVYTVAASLVCLAAIQPHPVAHNSYLDDDEEEFSRRPSPRTSPLPSKRFTHKYPEPKDNVSIKDEDIFTPYNTLFSKTYTTEGLDKYVDPFYQPVGNIHRLSDNLQFYAVGSTDSERAIIIISDMFGWNTGRTRKLADFLASNGYYVVIPRLITPGSAVKGRKESFLSNFFDRSKSGNFLKTITYERQIKPQLSSLINHCDECGVSEIGLFSFGWGSWVAANALASHDFDQLRCAVMVHPTLNTEELIFGGSTVDLLHHIDQAVLLIPSGGEPDSYRQGGEIFETLRENNQNTEILDLRNSAHGFLPRGDIADYENYKSINLTMSKTLSFFDKLF